MEIEDMLNFDLSSLGPKEVEGFEEEVTFDSLDESLQDKLFEEVVTELNASHLIRGVYPTLHNLSETVPELKKLNATQLHRLFKKVNESLQNARGCPPFKPKLKTSPTFDPSFIAAANLLADISDRRPVGAKLKALKIKTNTWNAWLRDPVYLEFWNKTVNRLMDEPLWEESRIALARNVASGDLNSIKYAHELTNKFSPKTELSAEFLTHLLAQIMEIIIRHTEPETARVIADSIETVAIDSHIKQLNS